MGTVNRYLCRGRRNVGSAGRCRPIWTTRRSKPGCFRVPRRCTTGSGPTARISTASSSPTASRCSCGGRSTPGPSGRLPPFPSSARSTANGRGGCGRRCGRCTGPARRHSSTSPGSGRRWSTGARVNRDPWSCRRRARRQQLHLRRGERDPAVASVWVSTEGGQACRTTGGKPHLSLIPTS